MRICLLGDFRSTLDEGYTNIINKSLPEMAGKAGIIVNPYDTDNIAQSMTRILTDNKLRDDMVRRGLG